MPNERTGLLILDAAPGAHAAVVCWPGRRQWLRLLADDLDSPTGREVRGRHRPSRAVVLAVAADDAAHADSRTGRHVATSWDRTARRVQAKGLRCSRDTVRRAQRVLRALGWSVEVARGRHLTIAERMRASLAGRPQHRAASVRDLTIPARCRHRIEHTADPTLHPHPAGVQKSPKSPSKPVARSARKRAPGTQPKPSKTRPQPVPLAIQRLTAALIARMPWLDTGEHPNGLSRGLIRAGITPAWTAQDVLSALDERNRAAGRLPLHAVSQRNPRGLLLHQVREATAGRTPPAVARAQAREAAQRQVRETHERLARDHAIRAANAARRAADPRPFRERWAETIAAAHQAHQTA